MQLQRIIDAAKEIKLVISDLDGTLIFNHGDISERTVSAVSALRSRGVHFSLATGRDYLQLQHYISRLKLTGPIVVNGGSRIVDAETGNAIWCKAIEREPLLRLTNGLVNANISFIVEDGTHWWISGKTFVEMWAEKTNAALLAGGHKTAEVIRLNLESNFEELVQCNPTKVVAITPTRSAAKRVEKLVRGTGLDGKKSGISSYDILPAGVNKAIGLQQLANFLGLERNECAAFGDYHNDIAMLKSVGLSFAMKNAVDEAKAAATLVIGSAKDDGVARCLEQFFLQ